MNTGGLPGCPALPSAAAGPAQVWKPRAESQPRVPKCQTALVADHPPASGKVEQMEFSFGQKTHYSFLKMRIIDCIAENGCRDVSTHSVSIS